MNHESLGLGLTPHMYLTVMSLTPDESGNLAICMEPLTEDESLISIAGLSAERQSV